MVRLLRHAQGGSYSHHYDFAIYGLTPAGAAISGQIPIRKGADFAIVSIGPDDLFPGTGTGADSRRGYPYDPSNGLVSFGDIIYRPSGSK